MCDTKVRTRNLGPGTMGTVGRTNVSVSGRASSVVSPRVLGGTSLIIALYKSTTSGYPVAPPRIGHRR